MSPGPVPDPPRAVAAEVEAEEEPVVDGHVAGVDGLAVAEQQGLAPVEVAQVVVGELGAADGEAELVEAQVLAHPDGEGQRHDLEVEVAGVTRGHLVEAVAAVGDDPGEDVEAAGRALGVGLAGHARRQGQALLQRDEVRPVGLEHGALPVEVELVDHVVLHPLGHGVPPGQEAAPDAVGHLAEAQVEAGGLDVLPRDGEAPRRDDAGVDGGGEVLAGEDAFLAGRHDGRRHRRRGHR